MSRYGEIRAALGSMKPVAYFLKSLGMSRRPLPQRWWEQRPEILDGVFFNRRSQAIKPHDTLIYYAVGTGGRLCAFADVLAEATENFRRPSNWTPDMARKFKWRMPVRVIVKCAADGRAPRLSDFQKQ